jgi:putative membrane protein
MRKLLIRWVWLALAVVAASLLTRMLGLGFKVEIGSVDQILKLLVGVAVLSFANATLGRILKLLTIPLNCLTLGAFSLVVNAVVLWAVALLNFGFSITGDGFVSQFLAAFVGSLLISICNGVLRVILPDDKDDD